MKYDASIIDQLVAIKLHKLAGTTPDCTVPDGWAAAGDALSIGDSELEKIGAPRAWAFAWEVAIDSASISLNNPAGDGSELRKLVANMRARYEEALKLESEEREIDRRNQRRSTREDRAMKKRPS